MIVLDRWDRVRPDDTDAIPVSPEQYRNLIFGNTITIQGVNLTIEDGPFAIETSRVSAVERGGPGSGHHGHRGRPGERGGSLPREMGRIFNPDDIRDVPKVPGFCFSTSAEWLLYGQGAEYPQAKLVHGTVMGRGPIEGKRFTHAWVEIDDWVFDPSQNLLIEKDSYYDLGQVEDAVSYTSDETRTELLRNEHWGPWDEKLLNFREEEAKGWFQ